LAGFIADSTRPSSPRSRRPARYISIAADRGLPLPIDEQTLGFADFAGNRQYITISNLAEA
jgi:predicted pyridoxine 5'-phosphate oxidase superfamily flavin-nucleotide-binding protein